MIKSIEVVDKQHFLDSSEEGFLFYDKILGGLELKDSGSCKNTHNPFYNDSKPAFSVFYYNGMWRHKDFGDDTFNGDVFNFAAQHYSLDVKKDFKQILHRMYEDLEIEKGSTYVEISDAIFEIGFKVKGDWYSDSAGLEKAYDYFKQFGITKEVLKRFRVRAIKEYDYVNRDGKIKTWRYKENELAIAYEDANHVKIYCPKADEFKFIYRGSKPAWYVFGQAEIIRDMIKTKRWERDLLIITGGEKDVMSLVSLGYDAISFNSETGNPPKELEDSILNNYKYILVMYDIDETGIRAASRLQKKYGFRTCMLPEALKLAGGKDISDYIKLGLSKEVLKKAIDEAVLVVPRVQKMGKIGRLIKVESGYVNSKGVYIPFIMEGDFDSCENMAVDKNSNIESTVIEKDDENNGLFATMIDFSKSKDSSPLFPDIMFDNLPAILSAICNQFEDPRERDMILLSSLTVFSSLMPNVRSINNGKEVGTNINVMITAPAASGKGVNNWAKEIAFGVKTYLKESYSKAYEEYINAMTAYKQKQIQEEPEKPIRRSVFIPANNSVSNIYKMIEANRNFGIIFETEGDTLTESLKTEWGHFSDVIRKCFHHETISLARKASDEFIEVDKPHLSIFLTGTPDQVSSLIKSVENGFFSRFAFYNFSAPTEWKSQFKHRDNGREQFFAEVSGIVFEHWQVLEQSGNMHVIFTDRQIAEVDEYFAKMQKEMFECFGSDIVASVNRSCLIWQRLTMILSALRTLEQSENLPLEVKVDDVDASTALAVINVLLTHLKAIFTRMSQAAVGSLLNAQQTKLWNALPEKFSRNEFKDIVKSCNIMDKTGEKYCNDFIKKGLLTRVKHGEYCKIR